MYYLDQRLSKILSDIRIEQAEQIRLRRQCNQSKDRLRQRLGLWLIAQGETLAESSPRAA
jgi:hypothetical protein